MTKKESKVKNIRQNVSRISFIRVRTTCQTIDATATGEQSRDEASGMSRDLGTRHAGDIRVVEHLGVVQLPLKVLQAAAQHQRNVSRRQVLRYISSRLMQLRFILSKLGKMKMNMKLKQKLKIILKKIEHTVMLNGDDTAEAAMI